MVQCIVKLKIYKLMYFSKVLQQKSARRYHLPSSTTWYSRELISQTSNILGKIKPWMRLMTMQGLLQPQTLLALPIELFSDCVVTSSTMILSTSSSRMPSECGEWNYSHSLNVILGPNAQNPGHPPWTVPSPSILACGAYPPRQSP